MKTTCSKVAHEQTLPDKLELSQDTESDLNLHAHIHPCICLVQK